jgi:hypothetical protein
MDKEGTDALDNFAIVFEFTAPTVAASARPTCANLPLGQSPLKRISLVRQLLDRCLRCGKLRCHLIPWYEPHHAPISAKARKPHLGLPLSAAQHSLDR